MRAGRSTSPRSRACTRRSAPGRSPASTSPTPGAAGASMPDGAPPRADASSSGSATSSRRSRRISGSGSSTPPGKPSSAAIRPGRSGTAPTGRASSASMSSSPPSVTGSSARSRRVIACRSCSSPATLTRRASRCTSRWPTRGSARAAAHASSAIPASASARRASTRWWTTARAAGGCRSTPPTACTARPATSRTRTTSSPGRRPKAARGRTTRRCSMANVAPESELWRPSPARIRDANLTRFTSCVNARRGTRLGDYSELYAWSLAEPAAFWSELARFADVRAEWGAGPLIEHPERMPGARFFPQARLNFAENLLRFDDGREALVFRNECGALRSLSYRELRAEEARIADGLRAAGVAAGDRVAGFVPNLPEAAIAMLATATIGAIWSSCSPDFGVRGVLDRFGQIAPRVLFTADGYFYAGKQLDSLASMSEVLAKLPSVERVVVIPYAEREPGLARLGAAASRAVLWEEFGSGSAPPEFALHPFNHPLYILYSSGTTGVPKCIVHGAGGTLLQHLKEHLLHTDLKRSDRLFYFTTCGWMMWNWLMSGLACGATLVLYDGSPFHPQPGVPRRAPVPRARHGGRHLRRCRPSAARRARGARVHGALPLDADRVLERSRRSQVPGRLLRALPRRLAPRRLRRAHRARRTRDLRALGCGAEPRRRAHRHRGDLFRGREPAADSGSARGRPGLAGRRAGRAVRAAQGRRRARRGPAEGDPQSHPQADHPETRAGENHRRARHPAHALGQGHRARGPQRDPRTAGQERGCARQRRGAELLPRSPRPSVLSLTCALPLRARAMRRPSTPARRRRLSSSATVPSSTSEGFGRMSRSSPGSSGSMRCGGVSARRRRVARRFSRGRCAHSECPRRARRCADCTSGAAWVAARPSSWICSSGACRPGRRGGYISTASCTRCTRSLRASPVSAPRSKRSRGRCRAPRGCCASMSCTWRISPTR